MSLTLSLLLSLLVPGIKSESIRAVNKEASLFWERELEDSNGHDDKCGLTPQTRRDEILTILRGVSNRGDLNTNGSPQNNAAEWLIGADTFSVCPGDEKLVQRYVMALLYYSTGGDSWTTCGQGDPVCTTSGAVSYLTDVHECEWFGNGCDADLCMTEIIFEANNIAGTIPFELEQLTGLQVLSLEQGTLGQTIPRSIGSLSDLRIIDLDFNRISGSVPLEVFGLSKLQQLDLNSNRLTGTLPATIGDLAELQLLQLYENFMTGTIPQQLGDLKSLVIAEFYNNTFTGVMPQSACDNRSPDGALTGLTSDCFPNPTPQVDCSCCTGCAVW